MFDFIPLNNDYYTFYQGQLWKHNATQSGRNNFYGENNAKLLPNMWRPLWTDVTDPSATLLKSHSKDK